MKSSLTKSFSLLMSAVYLLITLSPFASAAFHSKSFFSSVSRECSGDCRKCGCSAEKSASRACCCWQKKQALARKEQTAHASCPTGSKLPSESKDPCCNNDVAHEDNHGGHDDMVVATSSGEAQQDKASISISTCPCGNDKDQVFHGSGSSQHMPFSFTASIPVRNLILVSFLQPGRLDSIYSDPPDPPPRLAFIS